MTNATLAAKREPSALFRWLILLFISLAMFGNYYIYDSVSPLADLLVKQLNFTDSDIGLLNAIYSIPNIFMVLIGGIIIDKYGTRISTLIFAFFCMSGAIVTASSGDLTVMAAGRLLFGLGAESLIVAITTIIGRWFKGKQLSFAFGLNLTIARLGSFAALNSPSWGKSFYGNWQGPLIVAVTMGIISVVAVIIYWGMDKYAENKLAVREVAKQDEIKLKEIFNFNKSYWFIVLLCVTFYSAMFPFQTFAVKFFKDVHLTAVSDDVARGMGGFLSSMLTLSAMILTPLFGLLSDKIGKRSLLMMLGSFLIIPVYLIMVYFKVQSVIPPELVATFSFSGAADSGFFTSLFAWISNFAEMVKILFVYFPNLVIPMAIMGVAFSLVPAVLWPSVALIVDESRLGTAYGLMTMIQNIGLAGFNLIIGFSNDFGQASAANPGGYTLGMWIFSSLGLFGLVFTFFLRRSEMGPHGHGLEKGMGK
jgi:MFS family permease